MESKQEKFPGPRDSSRALPIHSKSKNQAFLPSCFPHKQLFIPWFKNKECRNAGKK
jgi:hypothetical protein